MDEAIVERITDKGTQSLKKIKKSIQKKFSEVYAEKEDDFESDFQSTIEKLLKKKKLIETEEGYSINLDNNTKRKRSANEEDKAPEPSAKKSLKESKIEIKENATTSKPLKIEELWKNGEKLWRENGFDAEYLRTNPDK